MARCESPAISCTRDAEFIATRALEKQNGTAGCEWEPLCRPCAAERVLTIGAEPGTQLWHMRPIVNLPHQFSRTAAFLDLKLLRAQVAGLAAENDREQEEAYARSGDSEEFGPDTSTGFEDYGYSLHAGEQATAIRDILDPAGAVARRQEQLEMVAPS